MIKKCPKYHYVPFIALGCVYITLGTMEFSLNFSIRFLYILLGTTYLGMTYLKSSYKE
ncbi:Region of a membrane-bound protein predicted to be embedded in the membrane [Methanobacterium congolense]|uniref:Region of a membrane-bound protein predicted to be embedded in the membrane n=1 Tax=Methanobacterium congolense TaxID=118062 RepID=A0A1D3L045_9EURY|nr:Region of a membrane-bound protein predicted to be embedded in the membrane [Methanobacterium congolense]